MRILLVIAYSLGLSVNAIAADRTIIEATSLNERSGTLEFPSSTIVRRDKKTTLCLDPKGVVVEAKLWMPDHNHGTTPTKILKATSSCYRIEKLNFIMDGKWELRVKMSDKDRIVFSFDVGE